VSNRDCASMRTAKARRTVQRFSSGPATVAPIRSGPER